MQTTFDQSHGFADKTTAGIDRLSSGAHQAVDRLAHAAATTAEQIGRRGGEFRARQAQLSEAALDVVRRHPVASVGIALGVGMLLSALSMVNGRSSPH
jgi:ElaB/YqjD/DUF883 family membrane-anchored ribosome-binding protein